MTELVSNQLNSKDKENSVEILCIGSELLLGSILNSNAKWLAEQLASIGLEHFRQTVVGDNLERIKQTIQEISNRSRILITTGGLGPTPDDLTTEAIAAAFNTRLVESKEILIDLEEKYKLSSEKMPTINKTQALHPEGSDLIQNPTGTAPGIIWNPKPGFTIITLPGVPSEMEKMFSINAINWLKSNLLIKDVIMSKTLKFTGISESSLAEKVGDIMSGENPTIAPYASLGEVKLRITAKAKNHRDAKKLIMPIETKLLKIGKKFYFGSNDETLASVVIKSLKEHSETISIAESCTGGALGAALTSIPGASDVFLGGVIVYSNWIKHHFLDVPLDMLERNGAVSSSVAKEMAKRVREKFQTDWGLAITGIAGPAGGTQEKPVGLVHFGIASQSIIKSIQVNFSSHKTREEIQQLSVIRSLDLLRLFMHNQS